MSSAVPYAADYIVSILRRMSDDELRAVKFTDFQMWPARKITPGKIIRELISNERARRRP